MTSDRAHRPPRFTIAVSELLICAAILSALWAILLPAVNAARDTHPVVNDKGEFQELPPLLPQLKPLYERNPWPFIVGTPLVVTGCLAAIFGIARSVLPEKVRRHFPWKAPPKTPVPPREPIVDSRPAIITSVLALSATAILLFTASHVRADRTNRRPVVTWEGPIADYVGHVAIFGWTLSVIAIVFGAYTLSRFRSKLNPLAAVAMGLAFLNFFGSCLFYAAVYED